MEQNNEAQRLIDKLRAGQLSEEEKATLEDWYILWGRDKKIDLAEEEIESNLTQIEARLPHLIRKTHRLIYWPRYVAAAAIIILAFSVSLILFNKHGNTHQQVAANIKLVKPGVNGATLTLSNGRTIVLNSNNNGLVAADGGSNINKANDGELAYTLKDAATATLAYNTLATGKGEQYKLVLPDGTRVWLNAGSSLKYPTTFAGVTNRKVELTGEGYFEVAKDAKHPFIVTSAGQEVEVLGTHFNITSYPDDARALTTLIEGSVQINNQLLKPGQQAVLTGKQLNINNIDALSAIAWTKGRFRFNGENITDIMKTISRWYNIEVVFKGDMRGKDFAGGFSRYDDVKVILDLLASTNHLRYSIEGRRVTIMN